MIRVKRVLECTCEREGCGHVWITKSDTLPIACPKCKSRNWNGRPERVHVPMGENDPPVEELRGRTADYAHWDERQYKLADDRPPRFDAEEAKKQAWHGTPLTDLYPDAAEREIVPIEEA